MNRGCSGMNIGWLGVNSWPVGRRAPYDHTNVVPERQFKHQRAVARLLISEVARQIVHVVPDQTSGESWWRSTYPDRVDRRDSVPATRRLGLLVNRVMTAPTMVLG